MIRIFLGIILAFELTGCKPHPTPPTNALAEPVPAKPKRWFQFPTDNHYLLQENAEDQFFAPTTTARPWSSGSFGCVRNSGTRLHEGIDIHSIKRDEDEEPMDPVRAATSGKIVHINRNIAASNYGKYVVVAHEMNGVQFYTLYAHLRTVLEGLEIGRNVDSGDELGVLGRTTNTSSGIASWRAHLHFEIGVQINSRFNGWFKSWYRDGNNLHGSWNGLNLLGLDAADILKRDHAGNFELGEYLMSLPVLCRVRVNRQKLDWLDRYPKLINDGSEATNAPHAWDLDLSFSGIPIRATPVRDPDLKLAANYMILNVDADVRRQHPCSGLVFQKGQKWVFTSKGQRQMDLLIFR